MSSVLLNIYIFQDNTKQGKQIILIITRVISLRLINHINKTKQNDPGSWDYLFFSFLNKWHNYVSFTITGISELLLKGFWN